MVLRGVIVCLWALEIKYLNKSVFYPFFRTGMAVVQCAPNQGPLFTVTGDAPAGTPVCQDDLVIACQMVTVDRNYLDNESIKAHQLIEGVFMEKIEADQDGTAFFKVVLKKGMVECN